MRRSGVRITWAASTPLSVAARAYIAPRRVERLAADLPLLTCIDQKSAPPCGFGALPTQQTGKFGPDKTHGVAQRGAAASKQDNRTP